MAWLFENPAEEPVDPEVFVFATNIYAATCAGLAGRVFSGPAAEMPEVTPGDLGLSAVAEAFQDLDPAVRESLLWRVQAWTKGVAQASGDPRFSGHVVDDAEQIQVSEAFCHAYAVCDFAGRGLDRTIPLDAVLAILTRAAAAQDLQS